MALIHDVPKQERRQMCSRSPVVRNRTEEQNRRADVLSSDLPREDGASGERTDTGAHQYRLVPTNHTNHQEVNPSDDSRLFLLSHIMTLNSDALRRTCNVYLHHLKTTGNISWRRVRAE